ncbi:MAG: S41 family peptidase [Aquaticitalea sp.]
MVRHYLLLIFCSQFVIISAQNDASFCKQLTAIQDLITNTHYSPKPVNDSLSKGVFDLFLEQLDGNKRFFLQSDIDTFKEDIFKIDDYLLDNSCEFIEKYAETLKRRIESSKQIVESFRTKPLDYSGKDTLYFKPIETRGYFSSEDNANRYWNKRLRYLILSKMIEDDSLIDNVKANFKVQEAALKPKIIDQQLCLLEEALRQNTNFNTYVQELFINALLHYEDPNSSFFNTSEKTEFEGNLSNNQLTFGIVTNKTNEGDIVISYIMPGSAAFKHNDIEEADILLSMKSGNDVLEVFCVSNEDILTFMNDETHQTIRFKVKKSDGSVKDIKLTKAMTRVEQNAIRGYIIENTLAVGYIKIPSFYTDLESPNGLGVANDFAKELFKLNKEDINGLIIDLRFNGGGSMKEAAELSGMFIDRGPLSIIKYSNGETYTIRDMNRGALFTKPIIILMNNYSASASEFLASALQDYGRAVIVGSPSHGKSSAQMILPLSEDESLGFSKITFEKFYRISGLSHQSLGVIPDVVLPSIYDNFKTNERYQKFALTNDSVEVSMSYKMIKSLPLQLLSDRSSKRVFENTSFKAIKRINAIMLKDYVDKNSQYPLTLDNIYTDLNTYNELWKTFHAEMDAQTSNIKTRNTISTDDILQYNEEDLQMNALMLEAIANDIYIEEAYSILLDLINPKNTN